MYRKGLDWMVWRAFDQAQVLRRDHKFVGPGGIVRKRELKGFRAGPPARGVSRGTKNVGSVK